MIGKFFKDVQIIFLDIDGVLCLYPEWQSGWIGNENDRLDASCCRNLKTVLEATGAKVILASSWRIFPENMQSLKAQLAAFDIDPSVIIGQTPNFRNKTGIKMHNERRWLEIYDCILKFGIFDYLIFDDFDLERWEKSRLIRCKQHTGLTAKLCDVAIRKLTQN